MTFELKDIKKIRKKFNLTQSDLAKRSCVSQSMIAKIESGYLEPTYSNAIKIFETLNSISEKKGLLAKDIMRRNILSIKPADQIKKAITLMKKYEVSQLPVIQKDQLIGTISETIILENLIEDKHATIVKEIMLDAPPTISMNTSKKVIVVLLRSFPIVIVTDKGLIVGIITKSDIIRDFYG